MKQTYLSFIQTTTHACFYMYYNTMFVNHRNGNTMYITKQASVLSRERNLYTFTNDIRLGVLFQKQTNMTCIPNVSVMFKTVS